MLYQRLDLASILCTAAGKDGVNVRFLQQQIIVGTDLGQQPIVERNNAIFQRIAGCPVRRTVAQGEVVGGKAANIDHNGLGNRAELELLEYRSRGRQCLREANRLRDTDGIDLAVELEADHTPVKEVLGKALILRAVMRGRQPHGKLNVHQLIRCIPACGIDLIGNGK